MIETIRRFYSNSFIDAQRQEAINLFLGNYTIAKGQPTLWELTTDYYLHHIDPRLGKETPRRYQCLCLCGLTGSYIKWWNAKNLENNTVMPMSRTRLLPKQEKTYEILQEEMWQEYYRPDSLSSIQKIFSYNMNSTLRNFHPRFLLRSIPLNPTIFLCSCSVSDISDTIKPHS